MGMGKEGVCFRGAGETPKVIPGANGDPREERFAQSNVSDKLPACVDDTAPRHGREILHLMRRDEPSLLDHCVGKKKRPPPKIEDVPNEDACNG